MLLFSICHLDRRGMRAELRGSPPTTPPTRHAMLCHAMPCHATLPLIPTAPTTPRERDGRALVYPPARGGTGGHPLPSPLASEISKNRMNLPLLMWLTERWGPPAVYRRILCATAMHSRS